LEKIWFSAKELDSYVITKSRVEKPTGFIRCHISRVENGHTVPAIEKLEKLAHELEIPIYQLFYDGEKPPILKLPESGTG
jgi:transcriptional regulator with XRE-family HTH domain